MPQIPIPLRSADPCRPRSRRRARLECDVHDGMVVKATMVLPGLGMPPVRAFRKGPPLAESGRLRVIGPPETSDPGGACAAAARIIFWIRLNFGEGDVTRSLHELPELAIRHGCGQSKSRQPNSVCRCFLGIMHWSPCERCRQEAKSSHRSSEREVSSTAPSPLNVVAGNRAVISSVPPNDRQKNDLAGCTLQKEPTRGILDPGQYRTRGISATVERCGGF